MHRNYGPFNKERFVGNTNTMEVHDLDNEKSACEIDFIDHEHIQTFRRDRLKTAEELKFAHCAHCINEESLIKHISYR